MKLKVVLWMVTGDDDKDEEQSKRSSSLATTRQLVSQSTKQAETTERGLSTERETQGVIGRRANNQSS